MLGVRDRQHVLEDGGVELEGCSRDGEGDAVGRADDEVRLPVLVVEEGREVVFDLAMLDEGSNVQGRSGSLFGRHTEGRKKGRKGRR